MKRVGLAFSAVISASLVLSLLLSCAPSITPTPAAPAQATPAPKATPAPAVASTPATPTPAARPARAAWEVEWERLMEAAKKERSLVVHGGGVGPPARDGIVSAFKTKFDVEVDFLTGRGAAMSERIIRERRAGIFNADIYVGGATTPTMQLKPEGVVEPLDGVIFLPDVTDDKLWRGGLYYDKEHRIAAGFGTAKPIMYVNPELVKPGEVKSLKDLLDPKWKGKIVINDPTTAGTSKDTMVTILELMGVDYLKKLVDQKPTVMRDQRLQVEWLVRGKFPIAVGAADSIVIEFTRAGVVVTPVVPAEGTHVSTGIGAVCLINRPPHPSTAKLFINWILTRDAQALFARLADHASRRVDVANDHLDPVRKPQPGVRYIIQDEEMQLKATEHMNLFKEIFKPVM